MKKDKEYLRAPPITVINIEFQARLQRRLNDASEGIDNELHRLITRWSHYKTYLTQHEASPSITEDIENFHRAVKHLGNHEYIP